MYYLKGYIPFEKLSNYYYDSQGPYRVILNADCLDKADISDVICCVSHSDQMHNILSSTPELLIKVRPSGIYYETEITENYRTRTLYHDIRLGIIEGSSPKYSFLQCWQEWTTIDAERVQIIKRILKLEDVGPVRKPAYPDSWVKCELLSIPITNQISIP